MKKDVSLMAVTNRLHKPVSRPKLAFDEADEKKKVRPLTHRLSRDRHGFGDQLIILLSDCIAGRNDLVASSAECPASTFAAIAPGIDNPHRSGLLTSSASLSEVRGRC
jgi:hypothetical protein